MADSENEASRAGDSHGDGAHGHGDAHGSGHDDSHGGGHGASEMGPVAGEKSWQDGLLCLLCGLSLMGLIQLMLYWSGLTVQDVTPEPGHEAQMER